MERRALAWNAPEMTEALIRLDPPASLTPEVRAWISQHSGVTLSRGRTEEGRSALMLRVRIKGGPGKHQDEVADLLTDLRLLGLRPSLVAAGQVAAHTTEAGTAEGLEQAGTA